MGKQGKKQTVTAISAPVRPMQVFLVLSICLVGTFYEVISCAAGLFLVGYILFCARQNGALALPKGYTLPAMVIVAAFYGLTALWGVDKGMGWLGFVKFLPLPLFVLASAQLDNGQRRVLLQSLPLTGVFMTVAAWLLGQIPAWEEYFFIDGRLAGFFQYPNAYGLFLLVGIVILAEGGRWDMKRGLCLAVLAVGIFLSGSRTVLVLLLAVVIVYAVKGTGGLSKWLPLGLMLLLLAGTGLYAALGGSAAVSRYLTASLSASSFVGRLLYFRDALPVILRHPFGLGYMGYYFTQGSFQTGVYTVLNIHNELLQLLLDVGWLPTAAVIYAIARAVWIGRNSQMGRMLCAVILAHSLFDFDMQFLGLGFVLLLAMELENKERVVYPWKRPLAAVGGVLGCVCLYFGLASGLYYAHAYQAAAAVYPGYTSAWLKLLVQAEDVDTMESTADAILARNGSCSLAWSAKARAAYAAGDFGTMIEYKQQAIALAKYTGAEYLDYFDMLVVGVQLYRANGDEASADYCLAQLEEIPAAMEQVMDGTSSLGWRIDDQPSLALPASYQQQLEQLAGQ
jgi:hypothetical protein